MISDHIFIPSLNNWSNTDIFWILSVVIGGVFNSVDDRKINLRLHRSQGIVGLLKRMKSTSNYRMTDDKAFSGSLKNSFKITMENDQSLESRKSQENYFLPENGVWEHNWRKGEFKTSKLFDFSGNKLPVIKKTSRRTTVF